MNTYLLRLVACLFLCISLNSFGAYYVKTDGTIVDPIQKTFGGSHSYSGNNLTSGADLSNAAIEFADLSDADLFGVTFNSAQLPYVNLSNANLSYASIIQSDMRGVNLQDANLSYVNLSLSILWFSNLSGANLTGANLENTHLSGVDFSNANLSGANLIGADIMGEVMTGFPGAVYDGATYSESTLFPSGFDPVAEGMIFVSEVPLPAGIYLFLSGLVGLGLEKESK